VPIILGKRRLEQAIDHPELDKNKGKFLALYPDNSCIAVDNRSGDAWTEYFDSIKKALDWLNDKYQIQS